MSLTVIPRAKFQHACAVRGKTYERVCQEAGVSDHTITKIVNGEPVRLATALKLSHYFASIAPLPELVDLLGVAS